MYECELCIGWPVQLDYLRDQSLLDVAPHLFTGHHYHQLGGQLNQAATGVTLNVDRSRERRDEGGDKH